MTATAAERGGLYELPAPADAGQLVVVFNPDAREAGKLLRPAIQDLTETFGESGIILVESDPNPVVHGEVVNDALAKAKAGEEPATVMVLSGDTVVGMTLSSIANGPFGGKRIGVGAVHIGGEGDNALFYGTRDAAKPSDIAKSGLAAILHPILLEVEEHGRKIHVVSAAGYLGIGSTADGAAAYNEARDEPKLLAQIASVWAASTESKPVVLGTNTGRPATGGHVWKVRDVTAAALPFMGGGRIRMSEASPSSSGLDLFLSPADVPRAILMYRMLTDRMEHVGVAPGQNFTFIPETNVPFHFDGQDTWDTFLDGILQRERLIIPAGAKATVSRTLRAVYPIVLPKKPYPDKDR